MQIKPNLETRFNIDMDWWEQEGRSFRVELWNHLCPECRQRFGTYRGTEAIDWVDPQTAEVQRVDGLWHSLRQCCAERPEYLGNDVTLPTAIFRVFLANGNEPLSAIEVWQRLARRDPETVLRLLVRGRSYYGIRPVQSGN